MQNKNIFYTLSAVFFFAVFYFFFFSPPADFPSSNIFKIEQGKSLRNVSLQLKEGQIIRSRTAFEALAIIFGGEKSVISSDYFFETKLPVYEVARRISKGEHHIVQIKVTIPEGLKNIEVADIFDTKLIYFDKDKFLSSALRQEGKLFPDTYYFFVTDSETEVIKAMSENFEKKIAPIRPEILLSGQTEENIIIMASIIEREAKGDADREFISGILWKRVAIGMPLQADAAPETYDRADLSETPISNPGVEAIRAAIYPQSSSYLYYLHDQEGNIHYAKNFDEHKANKLRYLK
ncbi:hypothetical protein A2814_00915 [Candidatus Nomurabacteria bacterium RIFCSPHIGHO2_01_FULL_38_19]|uniref:Endolytic murein transglycosylase n=1 Tax=Candidatus Nomurabacteria bacterium RIFCSPHIGHO2_01_FULL_38_19 TaxID=1801732 RepID=A0A1F6URY8_9BACT|nr:MAG: hypothetical protein A2814_00915 [Candidatus Nomurabacteria bacterium RIFCSPHIGHO2_01_FULL_38_19]